MIRSLNAHGIARRSARGFVSLVAWKLTHPLDRSIARQHLLVTPRNSPRLRYAPISVHPYRLLTTPATHPTPKSTSPDLAPLPSVPPRKQKIELRPGPVKPSSANQTATSAVATPSPADAEKDVKNVGDPAPQPGIVESARLDYGEASRHGILAPPPADASKIGKLWHQAKEYFVCSSEPITRYPDAQPRFLEILSQGLEARQHPPKTSR